MKKADSKGVSTVPIFKVGVDKFCFDGRGFRKIPFLCQLKSVFIAVVLVTI